MRVLLVDDELPVREVLTLQLEDFGFDLLPAADGAEALVLLAGGEAVDMLVTDLSMPGMDGLALIRAAQDNQPGLPAVLLTGYARDGIALALGGAVSGSFSLLRKPLAVADLIERLRALLPARPARGREAQAEAADFAYAGRPGEVDRYGAASKATLRRNVVPGLGPMDIRISVSAMTVSVSRERAAP